MSVTEVVDHAGIVWILKTFKPLHYIKEYGPLGSLGVPNRRCRSCCHSLGLEDMQAPSLHQGIWTLGNLGVPNRSCRSCCHNLGYQNVLAPSSHQGIDLGGAWMFLTEYLGPAGISWVLKTYNI